MKCTIFLIIFHFHMCAGHALAYTRERAQVPHTCATRVPHTKTKVQSKVQPRRETVSVHEDVKPIAIGE